MEEEIIEYKQKINIEDYKEYLIDFDIQELYTLIEKELKTDKFTF
jgi:hypothetical protein